MVYRCVYLVFVMNIGRFTYKNFDPRVIMREKSERCWKV